MMKYLIIPDSMVDTETRIAAHHALASARKELKLPMVEIKWFVSTRYSGKYQLKDYTFFENEPCTQGLFMRADPATIYIQALQVDNAIKSTVYHETFHLWQNLNGHNLTEEYAYGYSEDLEKRLSASGEDDGVYLDHMMGKDWSEAKQKEAPIKTPYSPRIMKQTAQSNNKPIKKIAYGRIVPKGE